MVSVLVLVFFCYYPLKGRIHGKIMRVNLVLSWNILVSPSMVIESLARLAFVFS